MGLETEVKQAHWRSSRFRLCPSLPHLLLSQLHSILDKEDEVLLTATEIGLT